MSRTEFPCRASGAGAFTMVILVRCPDQTVSLALESRLEHLISEGLITAYLGSDGWVTPNSKKHSTTSYAASTGKSRCTAFVSCF
jgi:hypothetical protein